MGSVTMYQDVSPIDALWALYQSQPKRVRKAFLLRLRNEELADAKEDQMIAFEKNLPAEEREAARRMADAVKEGMKEVKIAKQQGTHVGRDADDFLAELMDEEL